MAKASNEDKLNLLVDAIGEVNGYAIRESVAGSREMKDYNRTKWGLRASALALVAVMGITTVLMPRKGGAVVGPEPGAEGADVYADTASVGDEDEKIEFAPGEAELTLKSETWLFTSYSTYEVFVRNTLRDIGWDYFDASYTLYPNTLSGSYEEGYWMLVLASADKCDENGIKTGAHINVLYKDYVGASSPYVATDEEPAEVLLEKFSDEKYDEIVEKYGLDKGLTDVDEDAVLHGEFGVDPVVCNKEEKCACGADYEIISHAVSEDLLTYAAVFECSQGKCPNSSYDDDVDVLIRTYKYEKKEKTDSVDVLGIVSGKIYDIVPENDMLNLAKEYLGEDIPGATFTYYPGTLDENTPDGPVMYAGIHVDGGEAELLAKLHLAATWESEIVEQFTSDEYDKIAEKYGLSDGSGTVTVSCDGCEPLDISFEGAKGRDVKCLECGGEYKLLSHGVADDGVTYAAVYKCENEHEGDHGRVIVLIQKYGRCTDDLRFEDVNGDGLSDRVYIGPETGYDYSTYDGIMQAITDAMFRMRDDIPIIKGNGYENKSFDTLGRLLDAALDGKTQKELLEYVDLGDGRINRGQFLEPMRMMIERYPEQIAGEHEIMDVFEMMCRLDQEEFLSVDGLLENEYIYSEIFGSTDAPRTTANGDGSVTISYDSCDIRIISLYGDDEKTAPNFDILDVEDQTITVPAGCIGKITVAPVSEYGVIGTPATVYIGK